MKIRRYIKMGEGPQCCRSSPGEDLQWQGEGLQCCGSSWGRYAIQHRHTLTACRSSNGKEVKNGDPVRVGSWYVKDPDRVTVLNLLAVRWSARSEGMPVLYFVLIFHIVDFSETADRNSTKLKRKQDLKVIYQVVVIRADRKNKTAFLASDWLFTFSTSLQPLNAIHRNLSWSKISTTSTTFVCFSGLSEKNQMAARPLRDFRLLTAERNSTKLDRKQDLNVLYQVCVFGIIGKTRSSPWPLIDWGINWNRWTEFKEPWQEARSQPWPLIVWDIFSSPEPKTRVSYCHSAPSVVRPSVHRPA